MTKQNEDFKKLLETGNKNSIRLDERELFEMTEEEIEELLQQMTKQGLLKGNKETGYTLTTKGKIQGRIAQMQDFLK